MSTKKVLENYIQLIETEHFSKYEKDFAHKIQMGLLEGYQRGVYEPKMVSNVEAIINKENGLSDVEAIIDNVNRLSDVKAIINKGNGFSASVNRFHISTKGIFIHGNKSQVEFEYSDGSKTQRELGDLIFIISIIYNNKKYFEKLTITQFKKSTEKPQWYFNKKDKNDKYPDKEQLYLLARFPTFKGAKGSIIPMKEYNLSNYTNCLGSYGLLYKPGDFAFTSARIVEVLLRNSKSISIERILPSTDFYEPLMFCPTNLFHFRNTGKLCYIEYRPYRHYLRKPFFCYPIFQNNFLPVIGNSISSSNVHEFTEKYLRALIGELTFAYGFSYNRPAFQFLKDLMMAFRTKAKREKNKEIKDEILKFVDSFYQHDYRERQGEGGGQGEQGFGDFDYEGGGIGIIHTMINLGEGE
ncbi:hypothetical protein [Petrotoga halophila]|uniref:Uncharacterized protein n=1 Tax=Petrotoga halophila DSM 16923 TaxID=1122953 RepID=A0A2S5EBN3_9BACT|nr:hypothetical protein [Petrotoga halophila]POZ90550.1 hypothetical protein AA81_11360 [Petrotoga halophila DSM 16923]